MAEVAIATLAAIGPVLVSLADTSCSDLEGLSALIGRAERVIEEADRGLERLVLVRRDEIDFGRDLNGAIADVERAIKNLRRQLPKRNRKNKVSAVRRAWFRLFKKNHVQARKEEVEKALEELRGRLSRIHNAAMPLRLQ